jgi:hypothetical protein
MNSNKFSSLIRQLGSYKDVRIFLSFVKSGAFILGCVLLVLGFVSDLIYDRNWDLAGQAAYEEIEEKNIIDPREKSEVISKHLGKVPDCSLLIAISFCGGISCFCYALYKSVKCKDQAFNEMSEEQYTQQLIDFVSGERDEPPNKNE